ncbi:hypothetical protein KDA08_01895, partial [Candidatus Saccharibacteria bacterium]|nr:hypothetical protein [Candidatus Saccharibacteria bacterium]
IKLLTILILTISILIPINSYSNTKYNYVITIPCIDINTRQLLTVDINTKSVQDTQHWLTFVLNGTNREQVVEIIQKDNPSVPIEPVQFFVDFVNSACTPVVNKMIEKGVPGYHVEQIGLSS